MTELVSAVPGFTTALLTALRAVPAGDWGAAVPTIDIGRKKELDRETVMLMRVRGDEKYHALTGRHKDQDFEQSLFVLVSNPLATSTEAMDRAYEIYGVIELALRADKAIGREHGVLWQEIKTPSGTPTVETQGRGYVVESAVRFRTRI